MSIKEYYTHHKTQVSIIISSLITLVFALYNLYLGFKHQTLFNYSICVYYVLLFIIRLILLLAQPSERLYPLCSVIIIIINLAMIAPITLMCLKQKDVHYSVIPAISIATYTTYKIVRALLNYKSYHNDTNYSLRLIQLISLIDALMSILSLQYTLNMTFSSGNDQSSLVLSYVTSFLILIFINIISIVNIKKLFKNN